MMLTMICKMAVRTTRLKQGQEDFLQLIKPPTGSHIPITPQEKTKINKEIDRKLQELEDTGLSREQILLSKSQKGIPLASDPFFQFLKKNKLAREVYLKKSDRFTVEKVIDIALRQDIGPDTSYSRTTNEGRINPKGRAELLNNLPPREKESFDPASYNANHQTNMSKLYDELKPHQPLRHIFSPVSRYERMKTHMRKLKKYDIHWRNVELLRQFTTSIGNIKNRFANRLSSADQKKISMAIKTARHNCALPHYGRTLPPNKKNITSLEDEVKELGLQNVNIETGQIYYSRSRSMDSIQAESELKSDIDERYKRLLDKEKYQKLWIDTPDEQYEEDVILSERYARNVKSIQNEETGKKKKSIDVTKFTLKQLTGINEEDEIVQADDSEEARLAFEKRKREIAQSIERDVLQVSKILLQEKTML